MMYVSDWVEFKSDLKPTPSIPNADYYKIDQGSIFANFEKEKELLDYACTNGFDGLILYNIPKILERHDGYFNDDNNLLSWPQELARFIVFAKHFYHLEIEMVAPGSGSTAGMWENINDYYDLAAIGNGNLSNINAFQQYLEESCGNALTDYNPNDPTIGNYYNLGGYNSAYPVDEEGRYHPFDKAIIDILNIGTFQQHYANGLIAQNWWADIVAKIQKEYTLTGGDDIFEEEWCDESLVEAGCETYSSYNAIITEYEFWKDKNDYIYSYNTTTTSPSIDHTLYSIERSFREYKSLLYMMNCVNEKLETQMESYYGYSCTMNTNTYLIQLASASVKANGNYNAQTVSGSNSIASHYTFNSDTPFSNAHAEDYNFDKRSRIMANDIDGLADRVYLATYRQTPCHLWSDDAVNNSQSYGRRFKDVYAYFNYNSTRSIIYPLFSSRHYSFDKDYDVPTSSGVYKKHLGLYLSNSGPIYHGDNNNNGFTGTLGGVENIFTHFANLNEPCAAPSSNINAVTHTTIAPNSSTTINQHMYTYDIIKLTNVVADNLYEIESRKLSTGGTTTDKITIRHQSPTGKAIAFDNDKFIFKPQTNDNYYIIVKKSDCSVHNGSPLPTDPIPLQYQRNIIITDMGASGFANTDPNPGPITEYTNNIPVGFCWYRYADLNMIWDDDAGTPWSFQKTNNEDSNEDQEEVFKTNEFKFYPNPTSTGQLTIEGEGITAVEIFDIHGRLLLTQSNSLNINVSHLSIGLYQIRLSTKAGYFFKTISKIR
jgi:hypothetical protein